MLDELQAKNIALIEEASFAPAPGLTVITGETGSGKTAFLTALKLLVGERADSSMVREGADELSVNARMYTTTRSAAVKDSAGPKTSLGAEGSAADAFDLVAFQNNISKMPNRDKNSTAQENAEAEYVVKRTVSRDGRSRVWIDGQVESVGSLVETCGTTIDLCGQHEHQKLLEVAQHVRLLDAWAHDTIAPAYVAYQEAFLSKKEAEADYRRVTEIASTSEAKLEQATYIKTRIEELRPSAEEVEELKKKLPLAEHATKLAEHTRSSFEQLVGDSGAIALLQNAAAQLREASRLDEDIAPASQQLFSAATEAEDVQASLSSYLANLEIDPQELERMQKRQADLQALLRTFGPTMEDVDAQYAAATETLETMAHADESLQAAQEKLDVATARLRATAATLEEARREAAPRFVQAVTNEMAKLQMGTAVLEMQLSPLPEETWTEAGPSRVEFLYRPAQNLSAKPLKKIASGGELSRIMLAIKVVAGTADEVETLVFDEVDAGVGGNVALSLARVLKELSRTHQVICVTHLPQIASAADKHYVVKKIESADDATGTAIPKTMLEAVSGQERMQEIARMLSGEVSDISLSHAKTLLSSQ